MLAARKLSPSAVPADGTPRVKLFVAGERNWFAHVPHGMTATDWGRSIEIPDEMLEASRSMGQASAISADRYLLEFLK